MRRFLKIHTRARVKVYKRMHQMHQCISRIKIIITNHKIFTTMNKNQIRFVRTLTATWKVLRDPVLTTIYMKKWKRQRDRYRTLYGFVFKELYRAA